MYIHAYVTETTGNSNVICVFLDAKGAFDNINIECLIHVLHELVLTKKENSEMDFKFYVPTSTRTLFVKLNNKL